jgi:hypothetical protein
MNRKQRTILLMVIFWSVVFGVSGIWLWRADRQERLNRGLIAAIKREDTKAAIAALEQAADANARDKPMVPTWKRLWEMLRRHRPEASTAPTALLVSQYPVISTSRILQSRENYALTRALLTHGARLNEVNEQGYSPVWYAMLSRKTAVARLLIEQGANVSAGPGNNNILCMAVGHGQDATMVELMLQHGADANHADAVDQRPLELALIGQDTAIVQCLLRYHADPNATMKVFDDTSLLDYAEEHHLTEIAHLLREAGAKR